MKRRLSVVVGTRRVHRARVVGFQEDFTAIVYDGSDFEQMSANILSCVQLSTNCFSTEPQRSSVKTFGWFSFFTGYPNAFFHLADIPP